MCTPSCSGWQLCGADGGCQDQQGALHFTQPSAALTMKPGTLPVVLAFTNTGLSAYPPSVTLTAAQPDGGLLFNGPVSGDGGTYAQSLNLDAGDGVYALQGTYGLSSDSVSVTVDGTPPTVTVEVQAAPARPADGGWLAPQTWRRDEVPLVLVRGNEPLLDAGLSLEGAAAGVSRRMLGDCTGAGLGAGCLTGACYCFEADFSVPTLNALDGGFALAGTGVDFALNGAAGMKTEPVTRLRWVQDTGSGYVIHASPALASDGTVLVGDTNTNTNGNLYAYAPSGVRKWSQSLGAFEVSPAVGLVNGGATEVVYVAYNTSSGAVAEARSTSGGGLYNLATCAEPTYAARTSFALGQLNGLAGAGIALAHATSPALVAVRPDGALSNQKCDGALVTPNAANAIGANMVTDNAGTYYYPDDTRSVLGFAYTTSWASSPNSAWSQLGAPDGGAATQQFNGLAMNMALGSPHLVVSSAGCSGGPSCAGLAQVGVGSTYPTADWTQGTFSTSPSATDGTGFAFAGDASHSLVKASATGVLSAAATGTPRGAPVLGTKGLVYLQSDNRTLYVFDKTPMLQWAVPNVTGSTGTVYASPALDCNRLQPSAGRPGVLYLAAGSQIAAVVVDSDKLDGTATWPKYQRDARNSGNLQGGNLNPGCP